MSYQPPPPPSLLMRRGPHPNRPFPLGKDVITIGRGLDNDIVVDDAEVSRHHARLTRQGNDWVLEDLGSRNGTFVNGQRITGPVTLPPGAQVGLGTGILFSMEMGLPVAPAPPAYPPLPAYPWAYAPPRRKGRFGWLFVATPVAILLILAVLALLGLLAYLLLRPSAPESLAGAALAAAGPDVVLQEPATGTQVNLGDAVLVFALARDEVGVTRTELWINDQFVAQQDSPTPTGITPLSLVYSWAATTPGTHALLVRAFNSQGAMGMSPVAYVTVSGEPATEPPVAQYLVQPGDTLTSVARTMSTTVPAIQQQNPALGQTITPGQTIVVPVPTLTPTAQPPAPPPTTPVQPPAQPGAVVTSVQPAQPGVVITSVQPAQPGAVVTSVQPAQPPAPPNAPLKAPNLLSATPKDCSVTLVWQDNSDNELGFLVYRGVQGAPGFTLLPKAESAKSGTGSQVTYVDQVPNPDKYTYYVAAANAAGQAASNLRVVTVPPTTACIQPAGFKQVVFRPLTFKSTDPAHTSLDLYFSIADLAYRRIPEAQGTGLPPGDWSKQQQAAPAPASVYLEPGSSVVLTVIGDGWAGNQQSKYLGCFIQSHPQNELVSTKVWKGHGEEPTTKKGFDLTYRLWLENVTWGKGSTTKIPPPTNLRFAKSAAELDKIATCKPGKCDPKATRALVWDWTGNPKTIDGYILYRFYSCPGKDAQIIAPEVVGGPNEQGKVVPAWTVPSGCAARYQVSAFGPAGESPPSKPLDVVPVSVPIARVQVTFKKLTFKQPPKVASGVIVLRANQYFLYSSSLALQSTTYDLDKVALNKKQPNNMLPVNLGGGDSLQLAFDVVDMSGNPICKGQLLLPKPANNDWGPLAGSYTLKDSNCEVAVEIGKPAVLPAGQAARPRADVTSSHIYAIGKDVYMNIFNYGPDDLTANQVKLTTYWIDPTTKQPVNKQTILRWVSMATGGYQWVQMDSIPPSFVSLKPLPKFHVELTPVDFDDPYSGNNAWEGSPSAP
jgi:LysM repeat protein